MGPWPPTHLAEGDTLRRTRCLMGRLFTSAGESGGVGGEREGRLEPASPAGVLFVVGWGGRPEPASPAGELFDVGWGGRLLEAPAGAEELLVEGSYG